MKTLKILLLGITFLSALFFSYGGVLVILENSELPLYDFIMIFLSITLSLLSTIYHIVSFKYYRKKKSTRNLRKLFWIGTVGYSLFAIYVAVNEFVKFFLIELFNSDINYEVLIIMIPVFVYGIVNLIEVMALRKRIKHLKRASIEEEIDDIGNSNS